jgi:hypothetical protein
MPLRRASVSLKRGRAISVTRIAIKGEKLVYVLVADKRLSYNEGRSRIAYIGTTKKGVSRIAQSVATRAKDILNLRGVRSFHARVVTCKPRQRVKTWFRLERALLVAFRERFGEVPKCNAKGTKMKEDGVFDMFAKTRINAVIEDLS